MLVSTFEKLLPGWQVELKFATKGVWIKIVCMFTPEVSRHNRFKYNQDSSSY